MEKSAETGKIVIVHDSAAALPENLRAAKDSGLIEVPLTVGVTFGKRYKEWIDYPPKSRAEEEEFIHDIQTADKIVTSQPNPLIYYDCYKKIIDDGGTEIAVIPTSGGVSGSMNVAKLVAREFINRANIVVADCKTMSIGTTLLTMQAKRENEQNKFKNATELVNRVEGLSKELYLAQAFSNIDFLRKGGRITFAESLAANLLSIKPIIGVNAEGKLEKIDQQIGWRRTREAMVKYVSKEVGQRVVRLAIVYFESDQLENFRNDIKDKFVMATDDNGEEFDILECKQSRVLDAHSGLGVIGLGALALGKIN